jgi:ribosome-associated translation inhibitor RaiA
MQLTTTFRGMLPSPAVQAAVERSAARLQQLHARIIACHVAIEKPHRHHTHGSAFMIHIALVVPGTHITVSNQHHLDAYVALTDAFRAARRQLLDRAGARRELARPTSVRYAGLAGAAR